MLRVIVQSVMSSQKASAGVWMVKVVQSEMQLIEEWGLYQIGVGVQQAVQSET
jgi:hypothetical protein